MQEPEYRDAQGVLNAFLRVFFDDQQTGEVRSLIDYQKLFPGYDDCIAEKFERLQMAASGDVRGHASNSDEPSGRSESRDIETLKAPELARPSIDSPSVRPPSVRAPSIGPPAGPLDDTTEEKPEHIGPYVLLYSIGEGGMGTVYLAEQRSPIRRRVALKRIKLGMDSKEVISRFEAERQALAMMNHPSIARVFDAGTTEQGQPYFVMEYVQGSPITDYCNRERLNLRQRLELFLQLTAGVQHAHQKGIIHRDIKPSNVLVAIDGDKAVPKIIDFGIAKSVHQPLTDKTAFTQLGQMIGTPSYTSPEQAEAGHQDIDTRADIYSLGVLLYELLVGALPLDPGRMGVSSYAELQMLIIEYEPKLPSQRFLDLGEERAEIASHRSSEVGSLYRQIRGDLDWIIFKALEKDRRRRYASASEFGADLSRYLNFEPISARPPTVLYRMRKFARKRRTALVIALSMAVMLLSFWLFRSWIDAERRAQESREKYAEALQSLEEYDGGKREAKRLQLELRQEVERLEPWRPVWKRGRELELVELLDDQEDTYALHFREALLFFKASSEKAHVFSKEKTQVMSALQEKIWPLYREGGLGREAVLGPEFLTSIFRESSEGIGEIIKGSHRVQLVTEPAGAAVYCFRYEMVEGRLYPLAFAPKSGLVVGQPFLEIESVDSSETTLSLFRPGDRILRVGGDGVRLEGEFIEALADIDWGAEAPVLLLRDGRETTLSWIPFPKSRPINPLRSSDRLIEVEGNPAEDRSLHEFLGGVISGQTVSVQVERGGKRIPVSFVPFPLHPARDWVVSIGERTRPAFNLRGGSSNSMNGERLGMTFKAYPLDFHPDSRFGSSPIDCQLPDGSYLLVLKSPGHIDVRWPVRIPLLPRQVGEPMSIDMPARGDVPAGAVYVAGGLYSRGGDSRVDQDLKLEIEHPVVPGFFIQKFEVTVGDYLEFLNDSELKISITGEKAADSSWVQTRHGGPVHLIPYYKNAHLFYEKDGVWFPSRTYRSLDWPVFAVPLYAAAEYAHWKSEQSDGRWKFRLPTDVEWEKAARGVDLRYYVWGDYPVFSFCRSARGIRAGARPTEVGAYPYDESVYGVRDMAGNVSELTSDVANVRGIKTYSLRGGNWYAIDEYFIRIANRNGMRPDDRKSIDTGFRLVIEKQE